MSLSFDTSNAPMPFGPMVINMGLPSLVLAWIKKASSRTLTSVNPAFCRPCLTFSMVRAVCWFAFGWLVALGEDGLGVLAGD